MSHPTIEQMRAALAGFRRVDESGGDAPDVLEVAIHELEDLRKAKAELFDQARYWIRACAREERNAGHLRRALRAVADMRCCPLPSDHDAGEPDCPRVEAERALSAEKQRKARRRKAARR